MTQREISEKFEERRATANEWKTTAKTQIILAFTIGVFGLLVGILQKETGGWQRALTATLGFFIAAITLYTNLLYPVDYRTLQSAAEQADQLIADNSHIPEEYSTAPELDRAKWESDFGKFCDQFDEIRDQVHGAKKSSSGLTQKPLQKAGMLLWIDVVHAQTEETEPSWASSNGEAMGSITHFVGRGVDASFDKAKLLSEHSAQINGARWIQASQHASGQQAISSDDAYKLIPPPKLLELVEAESEIENTSFSLNKQTGVYTYLTRIRLPNRLQSIDTSALQGQVTISSDDSLVDKTTGLTLLLNHMVEHSKSTKLYVVSTNGATPYAIDSNQKGKQTEGDYTAELNKLFPKCNGQQKTVGGQIVWCFHVEQEDVTPRKGGSHLLGQVTSNGHKFDLSAIGFDNLTPSISLEFRNVK